MSTWSRPKRARLTPPRLSIRLSDRRFGIGGDGLILLCPSAGADLRMEMYNADGSRGEMCGNGIRCVARLAYESGLARRNPISIETDCGIKTVWLKLDDDRPVAATVDMGAPILEGREIPANADGRIINYPLKAGERTAEDYRSLDGQSALRGVRRERFGIQAARR